MNSLREITSISLLRDCTKYLFYLQLWQASDGSLYGTLRGHKRGIWCVAFSPVDKCLATASADSTIKIWAIQGLNCVKVTPLLRKFSQL